MDNLTLILNFVCYHKLKTIMQPTLIECHFHCRDCLWRSKQEFHRARDWTRRLKTLASISRHYSARFLPM